MRCYSPAARFGGCRAPSSLRTALFGLLVSMSCWGNLSGGLAEPFQQQPQFKTEFIDVPVDHFSPVASGTSSLFRLKYLVNDDACRNGSSACPVLFYCGGEDQIESFAEATGFLWEQSVALGAALVYAEHRYYGQSFPSIGDQAADTGGGFTYLHSQQALADFAMLASQLEFGGNIVAVGGSYGGMLAAWMRQKYPGTFAAALASSAPVLAFEDPAEDRLAPVPTEYWDVVAADFNATCQTQVKQAFGTLLGLAEDSKFQEIQEQLQLCSQPTTVTEAINTIALVQSALSDLAQHDYPYPTKFLFDLPAHPTAVACARFLDAGAGVGGLGAAAALVFQNTSMGCLAGNLSEWWAFNPGFIDGAWTFQRCTEVLMPVEVAKSNPMFLACDTERVPGNCWANGSGLATFCQRRFPNAGVFNVARLRQQRTSARVNHQGLAAFQAVGNILFSNGGRDPWHAAGGINLADVPSTPRVQVVSMPSGAHHIDLRAPNVTADPEDVVAARKTEVEFLRAHCLRHRVL